MPERGKPTINIGEESKLPLYKYFSYKSLLNVSLISLNFLVSEFNEKLIFFLLIEFASL